MTGPAGIYRDVMAADAFPDDDGGEVRVEPGHGIFVTLASAARSATYFPNPEAVDPRRPLDSYLYYGCEPHMRLVRDVSQLALVELARAVFGKKGLRRVAGPQGELKSIKGPVGSVVYMTEDWGGVRPFPTAMKVVWEGQ